jgi:hypothetical protein
MNTEPAKGGPRRPSLSSLAPGLGALPFLHGTSDDPGPVPLDAPQPQPLQQPRTPNPLPAPAPPRNAARHTGTPKPPA